MDTTSSDKLKGTRRQLFCVQLYLASGYIFF